MNTWKNYLSKNTFRLAQKLSLKALNERRNGAVVYPPQDKIFQALKLTPPESVRVVIIGQDPYHGEGQANGLAFSVNPDVPIPPSLKNIFKELVLDTGCKMPENGDLTKWAKNGILLLNTVLTVEEGKPNSHVDWGWQDFVRDVVVACMDLPQPIVFLLWGKQARTFIENCGLPERENKKFYATSHPSPLGATKGNMVIPAFIGSRPFTSANKMLVKMGTERIDWSL